MFIATIAPNKYDPLSPRNILALGKLKSKNEIKMIIWVVKKKENSVWLLLKFTNNKTEFIIIKLIVKRPLKPSIKFAPFIMKRKHRSIKKIEKTLFSSQEFKKIRSIFIISTGKKIMKMIRKIIIRTNLKLGLILVLISSKYPIINKLLHINKYS